MKEIYIYPAIFDYEDDGISISFPDLPGCFSCANTDEETVINAKEVLSLYIYDLEDGENIIPIPTLVSKINVDNDVSI